MKHSQTRISDINNTNYTRTHLYLFPHALPESKRAFEALKAIVDEAIAGDNKKLYEAFQLPATEGDIFFDKDSIVSNLSYIDIGVFSRDCFPEYNLTEALLKSYPVNMYLAYSEADESLLQKPTEESYRHNPYNRHRAYTSEHKCGIYRSVIIGMDLDTGDIIRNTKQFQYTGDADEIGWLFPLTPELNHEVFYQAWDDFDYPEGNTPEDFYNQLKLDESGIKDENGFPMFFPSWIESKFHYTR